MFFGRSISEERLIKVCVRLSLVRHSSLAHEERKLCPHRAPGADCASAEGHADPAVRGGEPGRRGKCVRSLLVRIRQVRWHNGTQGMLGETTRSRRFRRYPEIKTLEENEAFCKFVRGLLDEQ